MTSSEIRQSFLDFFKSKQHTIVPSSSLLPDSPNLLFTNAGMNQFVPIFLGQVKCPYNPPRAADTQKCIRAGGKHNDLDDVGLDTYHHTFFEMLGNWSFGDYFKKEAIEWAWELVTEVWKFPKNRLYATVYSPDKSQGDPSDFDQEAYDFWAAKFTAAGLDPKIHIVYGNKKDNFWMMGETGPCGPCSELHVDLTPAGDTKGSLVNKGDPRTIEIWNLVFIQFNARVIETRRDELGEGNFIEIPIEWAFDSLPAKHVDTGMGFERAASIIQGTNNFKDFANAKISNYETDIFRPIFDAIEKLSGKKYGSTLPKTGSTGDTEQEKIDVAFRVIADHIRTLSFAIADGIEPGNTDRNYVLRRIHRRMVRYAGNIDVAGEILLTAQDELVESIAVTMGYVFPEIRARKEYIKLVLRREACAFNKTLNNGIAMHEDSIIQLNALKEFLKEVPSRLTRVREELDSIPDTFPIPVRCLEIAWASFLKEIADRPTNSEFYQAMKGESYEGLISKFTTINWVNGPWKQFCKPVNSLYQALQDLGGSPKEFEDCRVRIRRELKNLEENLPLAAKTLDIFPGAVAFKLYDTYGFPLDLTELMARERGFTVDKEGFEVLMEEQRVRARAAQKKSVVSLSELGDVHTNFVGYESLEADCHVLSAGIAETPIVVVDVSPFYAAMGGQVGDTGNITFDSDKAHYRVIDTVKQGQAYILKLDETDEPIALPLGAPPTARLKVDAKRRHAIERHHTVTHLLHWALHEVVSKEASQKGSFVGPDKLTFDFNSAALTPAQVSDIEKLVNERILENAGVSWIEVPYADVKSRKDVMQFFGDKYGDKVRVVQIGGGAGELNGYSMELCGGTHTRATGEIGSFRIVSESAVAAGVRRIEAVAGLQAYQKTKHDAELIGSVAGKVNAPVAELEKKIDALLAQQRELEKSLRAAKQKEAAGDAKTLLSKAETINGIPAIIANISNADGDTLQTIADALKSQFKGMIVLGGAANGAVALVAAVSPDFTAKVQAGKIIQAIAPIVGGKGGGKPDNARGGGKDTAKLDEALAQAKSLLG